MIEEINIENYLDCIGRPIGCKMKDIQIPEEYYWCKRSSEYLYCLKHKIITKPSCCICGGEVSYVSFTNGYTKHCPNKKCSGNF